LEFFVGEFFFKSEVALEKTSKIIEHIIQTQHFVAFDFTIFRNLLKSTRQKQIHEKKIIPNSKPNRNQCETIDLGSNQKDQDLE